MGQRVRLSNTELPSVVQAWQKPTAGISTAKRRNRHLSGRLPDRRIAQTRAKGFAPRTPTFATFRSLEDGSACGRTFANREQVTIDDVTTDPAFSSHLDVARAAGFRAVQWTPLLNPNGDPFGMLSTHYDAPRRFSEMDLAQLNRHAQNLVSHIGAQFPISQRA
jgi:GAF domain-containing protein